MEFTAQGHVVGLAQRMEALAETGHICLSEHTARLVEGYFQLQELGRITVKGVSEPVGLFDLEAVGSFRTRFDRSRARSGSGQVVGVVAEAGTGKSRLCAEFVESCRARGIPILEGRGVAHGQDCDERLIATLLLADSRRFGYNALRYELGQIFIGGSL